MAFLTTINSYAGLAVKATTVSVIENFSGSPICTERYHFWRFLRFGVDTVYRRKNVLYLYWSILIGLSASLLWASFDFLEEMVEPVVLSVQLLEKFFYVRKPVHWQPSYSFSGLEQDFVLSGTISRFCLGLMKNRIQGQDEDCTDSMNFCCVASSLYWVCKCSWSGWSSVARKDTKPTVVNALLHVPGRSILPRVIN